MVNTPSSDNSFVSLGLCIHFVRQKTCGKDFSIENRSHICKNLYRGVKKPPRRASGELDCNFDATWSVFFLLNGHSKHKQNKTKTFLACLLLLTPGPRNSQSKMQKTFLLRAVYSGCLTPPRCSSACLSSCHGPVFPLFPVWFPSELELWSLIELPVLTAATPFVINLSELWGH